MFRIGSLILIFIIWGLLIAFVLGNITGPIKEILQESDETIKNVEDAKYTVNHVSNLPGNVQNSNKNINPKYDLKTPPIEVQRGNDDNSYFVSFEEIGPMRNGSNVLTENENRMTRKAIMKPYHERFLAEMKNLRDKFYGNRSRRQGKLSQSAPEMENVQSFDQGVNHYAIQAENIVTDIYHTANSIRKQLGVGRNEVPSKFVNTGETNKTFIAIDEILNDLKYQLRRTIGCTGCYNPHPELAEFLEWLVLENSCKLCATKSKTKENFRFFHRRLKNPIPCRKKTEGKPVKKTFSRNYEAAKAVMDDYINQQNFRIHN